MVYEAMEVRRVAVPGGKPLVVCSPRMEEVVDVLERVAPTDVTLLITGPSGCGKELLARAVHGMSPRRQRPLVVVDCGAIAESLIDRELFGHERGAYTGADRSAPGRLETAHGGTLVLDEIGELPLGVQAKLLRFLQEKQLTRVGGVQPRSVDARIVAVTHRDLESRVGEGTFREDLWHRLRVVHVEVPPLSERPEDLDALAETFLREFSQRYDKPFRPLSREARRRMRAYAWPGNVRELENRLLQAVLLSDGSKIQVADLQFEDALRGSDCMAVDSESGDPDPWCRLRTALARQVDAAASSPAPLARWLAEDLLLAARDVSDGTLLDGAEHLGMPKTTYRRQLRKAELETRHEIRPGGWEAVQSQLVELVRHDDAPEDSVLDRAQHLLLDEVMARFPGDTPRAAALMDVTERTLRRWLEEWET